MILHDLVVYEHIFGWPQGLAMELIMMSNVHKFKWFHTKIQVASGQMVVVNHAKVSQKDTTG